MLSRLPLLGLIILLSGCAASIPPVQVTRFHLNSDISRTSVAAAPGADTLEAGSYRSAVGSELARLGFTTANADTATYLYTTDVMRDTRERMTKKSPVSIGIGGGTGGLGGGIGIGASFGLGGNRSREMIVTRLSVQIRRRADQSVIWEGRAETEAPSSAPSAQPGLAASKLAAALFKDFPGESGRTIVVP